MPFLTLRISTSRLPLSWACSLALLLLFAAPAQPAAAAGSVTDCSTYGPGAGTLQDALVTAGNVTFACDGTIIVPEIIISADHHYRRHRP